MAKAKFRVGQVVILDGDQPRRVTEVFPTPTEFHYSLDQEGLLTYFEQSRLRKLTKKEMGI